MNRIKIRSLMIAVGLLTLTAHTTLAQTGGQSDQNFARQRDLVVLQNDLNVLDELLANAPRKNARSPEFEQRSNAIRQNVTRVAELMREQRDDRNEGRRYTRVPNSEVVSLRRDIATLRDDIENTTTRRGRANNNGYNVPAGTQIQVMLDQALSSRTSNPQDRITASTIEAIRMNGRTVIPAGATVSGFVQEVRSKHRGQNDGWLKVEFDSLTPEGGRPVAIRSQVVAVQDTNSGSNDKVKNTGIGAILGGVIGGLIDGKKGALIGAVVGAGGGLLASRGTDDVDLPEGTLLTLRLDSAMNTARRDGMGNSVQPASGQPATAQEQAEQLVARAYRAMLGREPDAASRVYVDKVLREGWTEADVSREIRNSPEYRNKTR
jgi:outer membrane lipoprotein SlyB